MEHMWGELTEKTSGQKTFVVEATAFQYGLSKILEVRGKLEKNFGVRRMSPPFSYIGR